MKKTKLAFGLLVGAALSWNAQAQTVDCDDVVWSDEVLERMDNAADYCLGVFREGENFYAQLHAQILEQRGQNTVVRYRQQDGTWGGREHVNPPRGFTAKIGGEDVEIRDLQRRQEVDVYVRDEGNFTVPTMTVAQVEETEPEPMAPPMAEQEARMEPAPVALPSTAGHANWLLVLGGLMLAMAATLRITRH